LFLLSSLAAVVVAVAVPFLLHIAFLVVVVVVQLFMD
jgi:hypothetical protein